MTARARPQTENNPQAMANTGCPSTMNRMDFIICSGLALTACAAASTVGVGTLRCKISPAMPCACINSLNSRVLKRTACILLLPPVFPNIFQVVLAVIRDKQFQLASGHILKQPASFLPGCGGQTRLQGSIGIEIQFVNQGVLLITI